MDIVKKGYKKLDLLFKEVLGITSKEFLRSKDSYELKKDLCALITISPPHHYNVKRDIILTKGCKVVFSEKNENYHFQSLGYTNTFYIDIVNPQIKSLGYIKVDLENFIESIK